MRAELVGRNGDLETLRGRLITTASEASAIEIVGDPGIGKTALLDAALAAFDGLVVRTAATAVEQPLTWSGLAQLVDHWPTADLAALPDGQRRSIDGALGRSDTPPEPGLVAAAVATLVDLAAARSTVVLAVDDAHWLDDATAGVVAFALRANRRRPVRLVCARRPLPSPLEPQRLVEPALFQSMMLSGLSTAGVHDMLADAGVELTRPQLVQVHEVTGGNPLHVLEFARRLARGEPAIDAVRSTSLESMVGQRVRALSAATVTVLGAAALTATPTSAVLTRCFDEATVTAALAEAERAQLITIVGTTVRFTHPTVAAAAEAALGTIDRTRLHRQLAAVVDDDERALHLDASTDGADESVATALDASARNARARGAIEVAARRMTRAIERTPTTSSDTRWERRLELADMLLDLGAGRDAVVAIDTGAEATAPIDTGLATRVLRTRATCHFHANDDATAAAELATLAASFPAGHPARVDALLSQARVMVFLDVATSVEVAALAATEAQATGDQGLIDTTMACELANRFLSGQPVSIPEPSHTYSRRLTASELLDELLVWSDDLDRADPGLARRLADAERSGDLASVVILLNLAADSCLRRGDPRGAHERHERIVELARVMDDRSPQTLGRAALALCAAHLGDPATSLAHLEAVARLTDELSTADQVAARASCGVAALLCGRPAEAAELLRAARAATLHLHMHDCNAMPFRAQLVEALLASGHTDEARVVSDEFMQFATTAGRPRGLGDAHRAAALVAAAEGELDTARTHIEAAIEAHDRLPGPIEGAWSRIEAGVIERRARRRAVARGYLERARDVCRQVGAEALALRAEAELRRTGGRAGAGLDQLTPAEEQVANLVALGHTNAEVGALLHMSAKTVEANLTRIYRKLGVRSRTELAARTAP